MDTSRTDKGLWAIWYDIAPADRDAYLDWFHRVHIPEKLSRPGYLWAAHYALEKNGTGCGYLALFGGETSHTFLNPSPGQLAKKQSAETKKFIGMRVKSAAAIFAEETRIDGPDAAARSGATSGPVIQMGHYDTPEPAFDDELGAWYAQHRLPALREMPGCIGTRKLLASIGAFKHGVLYEFTSLDMHRKHYLPHQSLANDPQNWSSRVSPLLLHAPRSPAVGKRLWPAV